MEEQWGKQAHMAIARMTETSRRQEENTYRPVVNATEEVPGTFPGLQYEEDNAREAHPGEEMGHILLSDLNKMAFAEDLDPTPSFRPNWLNLRHHPQMIPRYRRLRADERARVPELPAEMLAVFRAELLTENDWPWSTMGKVFVGAGTATTDPTDMGSGVLVGPNLMLTASHLVPWGFDPWWMRFVPAYRDGNGLFGSSYVRQVKSNRGIDGDHDYALCELKIPIGNAAGWIGSWYSRDDEFYEDRSWDSVGYPANFFGGERPAVEINVRPEHANEDDGEVRISFETPFVSGGWSGGPLFKRVQDGIRVVAVAKGTHTTDYLFWEDVDAVFTGGKPMVQLIRYGLENWPV